MGRKGFTLIELLVVIAVIAILAAILFPVFSHARERARQTQCLSNIKQIGAALIEYADNWDGGMPNYNAWPDRIKNSVDVQHHWKWCLLPFVHSRDLFLCPSNPVGWEDPSDYFHGYHIQVVSQEFKFPTSYGFNSWIYDSGTFFPDYPETKNDAVISIDDIRDPSGLIALGEIVVHPYGLIDPVSFLRSLAEIPKYANVHYIFEHGKQTNYAFLDGHVKALKAIQTHFPKDLWGERERLKVGPHLIHEGDFDYVFHALPSEYR